MKRIIPLCGVLAAVLFTLPGCLIGANSETTYSGRPVSEQTLEQVEPGDSEAAVLALLGEPSSRSIKASGAHVLKWEYSRETESKGSILFLLGANNKSSSTGAVYVLLRDGKVEKAWRD